MKSLPTVVLTLCAVLTTSVATAQELDRYLVPREARDVLVGMKATVHHGSNGGDYTADLTAEQAALLRHHGWQPTLLPDSGQGAQEAGGWTSYAQMRSDYLAYAAAYPDIAEYRLLGQSVQGRDIFGLRISDNIGLEEDEPEVMFWANIHGDEFASGEIAYDWGMNLLDAYGSDPTATAFVDDNEIWVVPLLNPDGHENGTRNNANNVDLNRDFGWNWDGWGGSPAPFSQPETRVLHDLLLENNVTLSVTMHCSGNVFLYPWCHSPNDSPEEPLIVAVGSLYANAASYTLLNSFADYQTHGELLDVIHGGHGALCYTAEISNSLAQYTNSYNRNAAGMDAFCAVAGKGLAGLVTDAQTGLPLRAAVFVEGSPYPAYTDPVVGDVHRMITAGTYDVTVWANGYQPETVNNVVVPAGGTGSFSVALQPGGGEHAFLVTTVNQRDPSDAFNNLTVASDALGAPDGKACSLAREGFIVLDLGAGHAINDGPGDDFTVTEALVTGDQVFEGYRVFVGDAFVQDTLVGVGVGTTSFDLSGTGVVSTRYMRIVDASSAATNDPLGGVELDALTVLNGIDGGFVTIGSGTPGASGTPSLTGSGDLTPAGAGFTLEIEGVAPSANGILFVSATEAGVPLTVAGVAFHVGVPWLAEVPVGVDGSGSLSLPGAIPPALAGLDIVLQALFADATGPSGVATGTNGLKLEIP
ncbi:MAG: M14 family zinc carboxypeptidase [Planctomycetota bacterium]|jgi:predicted deacylase